MMLPSWHVYPEGGRQRGLAVGDPVELVPFGALQISGRRHPGPYLGQADKPPQPKKRANKAIAAQKADK